MPKEIGTQIFFHCINPQLLCRASLVCHSWNKFINDDETIWGIASEILGYENYMEFDDTRALKDQIKDIHCATLQIGDRCINKKQFFDSIQEKYDIDLDAVGIDLLSKNELKPSILAKNYLNKPTLRVEDETAPIQFTYREGFEYIRNRVDYILKEFKEHPDVNLPLNVEFLTSPGTVCPVMYQALENINALDEEDFFSWMEVITHVLVQEKLLKFGES